MGDYQSRAAKIAARLNDNMKHLAEQGQIDKRKLAQPKVQENDTPEMRAKRRVAVEKLKTFLD
jgi:hypothetical protein